jgi:hypothetical protein
MRKFVSLEARGHRVTTAARESSAGPGPAPVRYLHGCRLHDLGPARECSPDQLLPCGFTHTAKVARVFTGHVHLCRFSLFLERDSRTGHRDHGPMIWVG